MSDKKITKKLNEIYDGWKNYIFPSDEIEKIAKKRIELCVSCDKLKTGDFCGVCGCWTPAKVRSENSQCPIGKW